MTSHTKKRSHRKSDKRGHRYNWCLIGEMPIKECPIKLHTYKACRCGKVRKA